MSGNITRGLALLGLVACTKESSQPPPAPCPPRGVSAAANPTVLAHEVHLTHESLPLRWIGADERLYELGFDAAQPIDLGPADGFPATTWDDDYWYATRCFEDCEGGTSTGVPRAVERIDKKTGVALRLGKGDYGLGSVLPYGDHVYWGVFGHYVGGLRRVSKSGGEQEDLGTKDYIEELRGFADGILARGYRSVLWIPASGGAAQTIVTVKGRVGAATVDDEDFYVADYGEQLWRSKDSGSILRISRTTGARTTLTGPIRWPTAIAVDDTTVYFMLSKSDEIRSVPKTGGIASVRVPGSEAAKPCHESLGLWATRHGLVSVRGSGRHGSSLYFTPWSALREPG